MLIAATLGTGQAKLSHNSPMLEIPHHDWRTGRLMGPSCVESTRTVTDVKSIFADQEAASQMDQSAPIYTTYGLADTGRPELLYATTVIYPGKVGNEFFMTRGHLHTNTDRGEFNITISGEGAMILMDSERKTTFQKMSKGSIHNVDGKLAHRVANTGIEPLIFLCVWMSDCGHDYETIMKSGFSQRLLCENGSPGLFPVP